MVGMDEVYKGGEGGQKMERRVGGCGGGHDCTRKKLTKKRKGRGVGKERVWHGWAAWQTWLQGVWSCERPRQPTASTGDDSPRGMCAGQRR